MTVRSGFGLRLGAALAGVEVDAIWWRYTELGGSSSLDQLAAHVEDCGACEPFEHNLIAQSLNEIYLDNGLEHFPVAYLSEPPVPTAAGTRASRPPSATVRKSMELRMRAARAQRQGMNVTRTATLLRAKAARLVLASGRLGTEHPAV